MAATRRGRLPAGRRSEQDDPDVLFLAASYARFSSDLQNPESIPDQQRVCRDKAQANGHTIPPVLEFSDEAVSGTKRQRDGLNQMLEAARQRRFGVLYLESLSRLARESVLTMPMLKELCTSTGCVSSA